MPNCKHFGEQPSANEDGGYADMFCDCHEWEAPRILAGGTNIAWPAGWTQQQAAAWRRENNLAPPGEPGSGS
jgi:hypothetical protein